MRAQDTWTTTATLTVWAYDSPRGASAGQNRLKRLSRQGAVAVEDAVTVSWVPGAHRPRVRHLSVGTSWKESKGSPLAALLELLLNLPHGTAGDHVSDHRLPRVGLSEAFLDDVQRALVPDSSAMLVISSRADFAAVREVIERGIARGDVRLLYASLTADAVEILAGLVERAPTAEL